MKRVQVFAVKWEKDKPVAFKTSETVYISLLDMIFNWMFSIQDYYIVENGKEIDFVFNLDFQEVELPTQTQLNKLQAFN